MSEAVRNTTETELESAFRTFSELSGNLIQTYQGLESQVQQLSDELARARSEQRRQLFEKDRLASRLSLLIASLPGGVVVLDGSGRVQECNPAARRLLGDRLEGRPWRDCVTECFRPRPDDGPDVSLTNGRRVNIDTCSLGDEPGQILLFKDVTENRQLQDQLEQLKRLSAMGEMAASLAHQVRTPLSSALLYAGGLQRNDLADADRQRFAGRLADVLKRLESLVQDMLSFARSGTLALEELELSDLLGSLAKALKATADRAGVDHLLHCDERHGRIRGNREALISGFQNLFNNAIEMTGTGLVLGLRCDQPRAG